MTKYISGVLIIALVLGLCVPAGAQAPIGTIPPGTNFGGISKGAIIGIVVGVVATVVVVAIVIIRHSAKSRTITGCVTTAPNGLVVTNEKDKRVYTLSGDTAGVKPGERMTLQGHKISFSGSNPLGWEVSQIQKDYGACQP
jgi:hypothetical protein